jgi:formate transporter
MPPAMAVRAEASGVKRASMDVTTLLALSVLAGAFVSFGAIFATTVSAGATEMPYGVGRLPVGLVFSAGLIMWAIFFP